MFALPLQLLQARKVYKAQEDYAEHMRRLVVSQHTSRRAENYARNLFRRKRGEVNMSEAEMSSTAKQIESAGKTEAPFKVHGYRPQSQSALDIVNENKVAEETILQQLDKLAGSGDCDGRWLAIARTNIEQGFMAMNRAVFKPERVKL